MRQPNHYYNNYHKYVWLIFLFCTASQLTAQSTIGVAQIQVEFDINKFFQIDQDSFEHAQKAQFETIKSQLIGVGFLYEYEGKSYMITCAHVIQGSILTNIKLHFPAQPHSNYDMKVLGADTFLDLAVLTFKEPVNLPYKPFHFSSQPNQVLGQKANIQTVKNQQAQQKNIIIQGWDDSTPSYKQLQLEATEALENGMSGSPILVGNEVVGMLCSMKSNNHKIGKGLDAHILKNSIEKIIKNPVKGSYKNIPRVFTGVVFAQNTTTNKVYLFDLMEDSPNVHLKKYINQPITKLQNQTIHSFEDVFEVLENTPIGTQLTISFGSQTEKLMTSPHALDHYFQAIAKHYFNKNETFDFISEPNKVILIDKKGANTQRILSAQRPNSNTTFMTKTSRELGVAIRLFAQQGSFSLNNTPIFNVNEQQRIPLLYY